MIKLESCRGVPLREEERYEERLCSWLGDGRDHVCLSGGLPGRRGGAVDGDRCGDGNRGANGSENRDGNGNGARVGRELPRSAISVCKNVWNHQIGISGL